MSTRGITMSLIDTIRKRIVYFQKEERYHIEEDIDCEVTDEIEKALWLLKEDLDLPTEEVEFAVESRQNCIKNST